MGIFKKKRETRLIFRDKTLRLVSGGNPDEQTGQITLRISDLGLMKKKREITLPISALDIDIVSILTSKQIRVDVPNFYANGQPVPIADRKEIMLRERLMQRESELIFAKKQLNSANQALNSASATPEDMVKKRIQELSELVGVVSPLMKAGQKSKSTTPSMIVSPEYMPQFPMSNQEEE